MFIIIITSMSLFTSSSYSWFRITFEGIKSPK